jgi:hypothetical protein
MKRSMIGIVGDGAKASPSTGIVGDGARSSMKSMTIGIVGDGVRRAMARQQIIRTYSSRPMMMGAHRRK